MKIDQRAIAIGAAALAFVVGTVVAKERTETAVLDQAKIEKVARGVAIKTNARLVEHVREQVAFRVCRAENFERANNRLDARTLEGSNRTEADARSKSRCWTAGQRPAPLPIYPCISLLLSRRSTYG